MSDLEYMMGLVGKELSGPTGITRVFGNVRDALNPDKDYRIKRKGGDWSMVRDGHDTLLRVKESLPNYRHGDKMLIQNVRSMKTLVVAVATDALKPAQTDGTPGIDLIYGAVLDEFDDEYDIINLGICADKPGQHHDCNAWDIGVRKPHSADAIHQAILRIANWLRNNTFDGKKLPVLGIIVMSQWCERQSNSMSSWQTYHGVSHVSHVHTSASPSRAPGWI